MSVRKILLVNDAGVQEVLEQPFILSEQLGASSTLLRNPQGDVPIQIFPQLLNNKAPMKCLQMIEKITLPSCRLNAPVRSDSIPNSAPCDLGKQVVFSLFFTLVALFFLTSYANAAMLTMTKLVTVPSGTIVAGDGLAVVSWTGGTGPFQVQCRNGFVGEWQDVGGPTDNSSQTNILTSQMSFYRVLDVSTAKKSTDLTAPTIPTGVAATLTGGSQVSLSWNASTDPQPKATGVKGYNVYRNGYFLYQVATPSTSMTDPSLTSLTTYNYAVSAVDSNYNESAQSTPVSISTDTTAPTVNVTSPAGGSTVSGSVSVGGSASDNVGVTRVEFYRDGNILVGSDSTSPYSVSDDTTGVSNGSHSYSAKAFDAAGNSTTSASVSVTVSNSAAPMTGTTIWARHFGGTAVTADKAYTYSVKEDHNSNTVAVGWFQGAVNFGGGSVTSTNGQEMFIIKYDASGNYLWSRQVSSSGGNRATAVTVDSSNNIVVVGTFFGAMDFGAGALNSAGNSDLFLAKFSPSGTLLWAKRFGGSAADVCNAIALDASNNILLTGSYGYYGSAIDFGGGPLPLSGGTGAFQSDMYVAKLTSNGNYVWANGYGGLGTDAGYGIAVDSLGNVAVTGSFQQSVAFGGTTFTSAGSYDMFVAEYSGANGSHLWSASGGGSGDDRGNATAFDASGNVLVTGYFTGNANIAGNSLSSPYNPGLSAIFLAKYSSAGSGLWVRGFTPVVSFGYGSGNGIAVDSVGNIVLTGNTCGAIGFDGTYLGNGDSDIFLAKLTATGNTVWAKSYGATGNDCGLAVSIGAGNAILVCGYFYQAADFGTGQMQSAANNDGFIFKTTP
jgi:hypothetical protein